jgi:adenine/guanine/hypoxanthine permease
MATLVTLVITVILFTRNVKGNFLISMLAGTAIAWLLGLIDLSILTAASFSLASYHNVFFPMSFDSITKLSFWAAVFLYLKLFQTVQLHPC